MSKEKQEKPVEAPAPELKTVEDWQKERETADWVYLAASFCADWPQNKMVSAAEYDAGIARVLDIRSK